MDLKEVNFGVTQFATQFTPVSRWWRASNRKERIKFSKVDNVISGRAKYGLLVHWFITSIWRKTTLSCFQLFDCRKVFSKLKFVLSTLSSILSRNMCISRCKLCNAKIYPLDFTNIFFFHFIYGQLWQFFPSLPDEASPIGTIHSFSKIAVTFEPLMGFSCPLGYRKFLITMK